MSRTSQKREAFFLCAVFKWNKSLCCVFCPETLVNQTQWLSVFVCFFFIQTSYANKNKVWINFNEFLTKGPLLISYISGLWKTDNTDPPLKRKPKQEWWNTHYVTCVSRWALRARWSCGRQMDGGGAIYSMSSKAQKRVLYDFLQLPAGTRIPASYAFICVPDFISI